MSTPRTDEIGIDHLNATEREYRYRKLSRDLEEENFRLRHALEAMLKLCDDCCIENEYTELAQAALSNTRHEPRGGE